MVEGEKGGAIIRRAGPHPSPAAVGEQDRTGREGVRTREPGVRRHVGTPVAATMEGDAMGSLLVRRCVEPVVIQVV